MIKYGINREFIEIAECYSTLICIKLCHTSCPQELSIYVIDTASEVALAKTKNIHKRKKSVVLGPKCNFLAHESVYLYTFKYGTVK